MRQKLVLPLLLVISLAWAGCAVLQKGADPIVVEAERVLTVGQGTLTLANNVDNANRSYWKTNAPMFHAFVEWLREPINLGGTNLIRRGPGFMYSLDYVKHAYLDGKATSNSVWTAIAAASAAVAQAQNWLSTVNTNTTQIP